MSERKIVVKNLSLPDKPQWTTYYEDNPQLTGFGETEQAAVEQLQTMDAFQRSVAEQESSEET